MNESVEVLRAALAALREAGVQRAQLKLDVLELSVEFPVVLPDMPMVGAEPTPGGWKTPISLDDPFLIDPTKDMRK